MLHVLEIVPLTVLAVLAWYAGHHRLEEWNGPAGSLTNELFIPAITMNAGQGFSNVDAGEIPELRAFLDFRADTFDVELLQGEIKSVALHPFQEYHRYLIYSVACIWHLFGVSWDSMKLLILLLFCLTVFFVYGICRLGMNAFISFFAALAFIYAQPVLWTLPILRDFAKAPFILALIFFLGITIRRKLDTVPYFLISLLTGLVLGVGMGFRRDMMVFIPVSLFFLLACRLRSGRHPCVTRLAGAGIVIALYFLSGWPVHKALYRDGYVAAHDTIMGFASYSDHELGLLEPASYEKHYLLNDLYCTLKAHDLAKRGVTFPVEIYNQFSNDVEFDFDMKQAYVEEIIKTFPADMITRAYAAVLRLTTAIVPSNVLLSQFIENRGVWFMIAGLLLLAAQKLRWAWLTLVLLCYFCGYTSIQFAFRHAFHMSFVPYFFAGLCLHHCCWGLRMLFQRLFFRDSNACLANLRGGLSGALGRAAMWAFITAVLLYTPLAIARIWQDIKVKTLRDSYEHAPMADVSHRTLIWNDRTLFIPTEGRACRLCQNMGLIVDMETRFLAAAFKESHEPIDIKFIYEWEGVSWDFSAPATFALRPGSEPVAFNFFFPVHEVTTCTNWNHFVGVSVPQKQAHLFEGFRQVEDLKRLGLLVNMAVPKQDTRFISAQRLKVPWSGGEWRPYWIYDDFNPFIVEMQIQDLLNQGDTNGALELTDKALTERPQSIQFVFLRAEILDKSGQQELALEECKTLLAHYPDTFVYFARLDRYFQDHGGPQRRFREWSALVEQHPALTCARYYLEEAKKQVSAENSLRDTTAVELD